ncbi:glycosyltransferase family 25 protein [Karstenula rhodostoma CBS 690.94]|uniref:Glycosyltransferase family 25 protein n=1 Tax=Karstenula rhodostoma CBS 690.94 TaxID=1392251 RepID=A0A9P4PSI6_9PLEO|nr:glycosyltransferase family 25 protein [Karstenula rhodostoma CBS 690.94]
MSIGIFGSGANILSFSRAARKLSLLTREIVNQQAPPAFEAKTQNAIKVAKRSTLPMTSADVHNAPTEPHGRDWDVLWLGHCGGDLPPPSRAAPDRVMLLNDFTVPSPKHLRLRDTSPPDPIATLYPPYTRVYCRTSNSTLCTLAYTVTHRGARKVLFELGIRDLSKGFDIALSDHCAGLVTGDGSGLDRKFECVIVQPPLFSRYWDESGRSDITGWGIGGRRDVGSRYVIRNVKANLEEFAEGSETLFEQWSELRGQAKGLDTVLPQGRPSRGATSL